MKNIILIVVSFISFQVWASSAVVEKWGGDGIQIQVLSDQSANLKLNCGKGFVRQGWKPGQSQISLNGTYTQNAKPGAAKPQAQRALYRANVDTQTGRMTLVMNIVGRPDATEFRLIRGQTGVIKRCQ